MSIKSIIFTILLTTISIVFAIPSFSQDVEGSVILSVGRYQGDSPAWEKAEDGGPPFWLRTDSWDLPDIGQFAAPTFGDLDGDGDVDALVGRSQGNCWAYENVGSSSSPVWLRRSAWDAPDIGAYAAPDLADIDADGALDLIVGNSGGAVRVYENTGSNMAPTWTRHQAWEIAAGSQYAFPRVVDLNGDLRPDLLVGTRFDGVKAYKNIGTANSPVWSPTPEWNAPSVGERTTVAAADLDGDRDFDLMLGNRAGDVLGFVNQGNSMTEPVWQSKSAWNLGNVGGYGYSAPSIVHTGGGVVPPPPPPPPPPSTSANISLVSVTFGFHYHNVPEYDTYGPADSLVISGYLNQLPAEVFSMVFDGDVTITVEIPDPLDQSKQRQIFKQTIPAGTGENNRFTSRNPGINDLRFSNYTSSATYMYLQVNKVMFLPDLKNASCYQGLGCPLTALEYRNDYILPIPSVTITVDIGGNLWQAEASLRPGDHNEHYQHLILGSQ
jgi:hypothetical protein